MEYYQAVSIKFIERMLLMKEYRKKSQIRDHISFLENLANRLNEDIIEQKANGILPWEIEAELRKVKELFGKLNDELAKLESVRMDKEPHMKDLF